MPLSLSLFLVRFRATDPRLKVEIEGRKYREQGKIVFLASEQRRLKLLRFRVEIQRVAKSCLQTGALAREHDKLRAGTLNETEGERQKGGELLSFQDQLKYPTVVGAKVGRRIRRRAARKIK